MGTPIVGLKIYVDVDVAEARRRIIYLQPDFIHCALH